jgi:hypothetical protein
MRIRLFMLGVLLLVIGGCSSVTSTPPATSSAKRSYNATASVGDFLTITLDPVALTLTYTNLSNGDSGTIPYQVNTDGTYQLNDPNHNLVAAYEVPNYALLVQAAKAGPNHDTPALITAVQQGKISLATWAGHQFNYMQFRTSSGGIEAGSVNIDAQGNVSNSSFSPSGLVYGQNGFNNGTFDASNFQSDPTGTFLTLTQNGSSDHIFGTANGIFVVDNSNGTILGFTTTAAKAFDPSVAGTYKAIFYQKVGAASGINNTETGTPSLGNATLVIGANASVTVNDAQGNTLVQATLTPVADTSYLYGSAGELADPCFGLFTFRVTTASVQQDVFVTFLDRALLFSSFSANLPQGSSSTYSYLYGVGLK